MTVRSIHPARRRLGVIIPTALLAVGLAGCGTATSPSDTTGTNTAASRPAHAVALERGWAKAGSGMTAVFGTVRNSTSHEVRITGGRADGVRAVEVHTMAKQPDGSMKMTKKDGGLVVPAGGSAELVPGGDHIMLLGLTKPLENGSEISLTMTADGADVVTWTVPVRTFAGADETYAPQHNG